MAETNEARRDGNLARAPGVCRATDAPDYSHRMIVVERLRRLLGCSLPVATLVAQLAGLGSEVRA